MQHMETNSLAIQCSVQEIQIATLRAWDYRVLVPGRTAASQVIPNSHTYASIVGIAYFPVLVSIAPFMLGSFTSIIKLLGIPVLFLILGPDSKFLSYSEGKRERRKKESSYLYLIWTNTECSLTASIICSALHIWSPLILTIAMWGKYCYEHLGLTEKKRQTWRIK